MVSGIVVVARRSGDIPWFEHRSCRSKIRHESRLEARAAARDTARRGGGRILPYHCGFCDGWHVGHPIRRR